MSVSGLAGYGPANQIQTMRVTDTFYVVGDLESDIRQGHSLLAPRVMVAAAHQAHAVVRLLLDLPEV